MNRRGARVTVPLLVAGVTLVFGVVIGGVRQAPAAAQTGAFTAISSADAASIEIVYSSAPLVPGGQVAFLSPASAQASVSSLGLSMAYASMPYPGPFVPTVPGTVAGASGGQIPAFPFPLYASSSHPATPSQQQDNGVVSLTAKSAARESDGEATGGGSTGDPAIAGIRAHSHSAERTDDMLTAEATSEVNGFAMGPLRIGRLSSRAQMTKKPGQEPTEASSLFVGDVTVAGTPVEVTKDGVVTGSGTVPPPDAASVTDLLKSAGIELTYVPASKTADTVQSAGVSVRYTTILPNQATLKIDYVLGRVLASIQSSAGGSTAGTQTGVVQPTTLGPASSPPDIFTAGDAAATAEPSGRTGGRRPAVALTPAGMFSPGPSGMSFYLVLVGAGMAAVACSQLIRLFAVRSARLHRRD